MLSAEMTQAALELPVEDRLELARQLIESVIRPAELTEAVKEGLKRIEDVATGKVVGLTEEQFRAVLG
jgi:putative addiction module component (TIGR02574 family)